MTKILLPWCRCLTHHLQVEAGVIGGASKASNHPHIKIQIFLKEHLKLDAWDNYGCSLLKDPPSASEP